MFRKLTGRETLGISLLLIVGLCSFGAWRSFSLMMTGSGVTEIWWPTLWFALLLTFFFFGTIVWSNGLVRITGAALIFLLGLLFIRSWEYIVVGIISAACMYWSSVSIAREGEDRTRFHFFKSVRAGSLFFIVGLSLLLSVGYYVSLKNASWEELVPRFRIGEQMTRIIFKIAGVVNPSFAKLSEGGLTVDEFLLSLEENQPDTLPVPQTSGNQQDVLNAYPELSQFLNGRALPPSFTMPSPKTPQELFLEGGRKQVATLVGRPVAGDEKISDVLSVALQNKLITFLSGEKTTQHISSQAVPFFLSLLLFLTLVSFVSIVAPLCILGAQLLFLFSLRVGWLTLGKTMVEQEKLVD